MCKKKRKISSLSVAQFYKVVFLQDNVQDRLTDQLIMVFQSN